MPATEAHVHHYVLEPPAGPFSVGLCACGEEREFANSDADGKVSPQQWNSLHGPHNERKPKESDDTPKSHLNAPVLTSSAARSKRSPKPKE